MLYNDIQQKERELLNTLNQTVYMLPPEMREMAVLVPPPQTRETEPPPNQTRWARPQTCQALPRKTWERFPRAAKELHARLQPLMMIRSRANRTFGESLVQCSV